MTTVPQETWPVVRPNDDGIRPAGRPDECFYCHSRIGQPHGRECVVVQQKVRYDVTFTLMRPCAGYPEGTKLLGKLVMYEPHHWNDYLMEFARNEGSWCASNASDDIEWQHPAAKGIVEQYIKDGGENDCLCNELEFELDEILDGRPHIDVKTAKDALASSPSAN